ncbi:MAG TPA: flagellar biosynthetic protein FliR [Janthinobacterium sp.]|jgi:flagellar biosynthetic protein FliR|nr:flagellar biosynthetic protein FliR [Janthinobacterium sp.]
MLTFSSAELNTWVAALLWPLTRILGLITAAPILGNASFPITSKVGLGVFLAILIGPAVPAAQAADPMSLGGLMVVLQELLIGVGMGFAIRIVFGAVEFAGEISSLTMGLGFASFFDPASQGRSSAVSQFMAALGTLLFLASNAHLVLLSALAESFTTLPISATPLNGAGFRQLAEWGVKVFSSGLQLSLPIVAALLLTNIALGILTRAAPSLNLFGIGFPITLTAGFIVIAATLPYLTGPLDNLFMQGIEASRSLARSWAAKNPPPAPPASLKPWPRPPP